MKTLVRLWIVVALFSRGAHAQAPLQPLDWDNSCWDDDVAADTTGAFIRFSSDEGINEFKSCVTISDLGIAQADRVEPHIYGGFKFRIGDVAFLADMGLEGQSGMEWKNEIGDNTAGMVPFIRVSIPRSNRTRQMRFASVGENEFRKSLMTHGGKKIVVSADNLEDSPFRFHRGDRVCMQWALAEEKNGAQYETVLTVSIDPKATLKSQLQSDGSYRTEVLADVLREFHQKLANPGPSENEASFSLGLLQGSLRTDLETSRVRFVTAEATVFRFNGSNLDDCQLDALWEGTQVHRTNASWEKFSVARALFPEEGCAGTTRWPARLGRAFFNDQSEVVSLRCGQSPMTLDEAQEILNSAVSRETRF